MKLHLPEIMEVLERKAFYVMTPEGQLLTIERKDKSRHGLTRRLLPFMHEAQKYIFDSGSDKAPDVIETYRNTALAMLETKSFHLPYKIVWIEDPFTDDQFQAENGEDIRFYYLAIEHETEIEVFHISRLPKFKSIQTDIRYMLSGFRMAIDLVKPDDKFTIYGINFEPQKDVARTAAEVVYALKKFLVAMFIKDTVRDRVPGKPYKAALPKKYRQYPFTIIRVPTDDDEADGVIREARDAHGFGTKKRKHPVAGYTWGRHTRPQEEWRFIAPYWRGTKEVVERDHYEVRMKHG